MPISLSQSFKTGQRQNSQAVPFKAPTGGLMSTALYGSDAPTDANSAILLYNLVANDYGLRVREGSREYSINVPDTSSATQGSIRTLMYYNSVNSSGVLDKFYACTDSGIYEVTGSTETPTLALAWPTTGGNAGWCSSINYTDVAGNQYLLVCDEVNGYYIYNGSTWAVGTFTGTPAPSAGDLVHIVEWQGRIWFVERDTATAWFLDPLALTGNITPINVGNRFIRGGHLVQNATWTMDDGAGMDDKFIMLSSGGDVLVFSGVNPTVADDLTIVGRWTVGKIPAGRRNMSNFGGDVAILSSDGIIKASTLLQGITSVSADASVTNNIVRYFRREMDDKINAYGWQIELNPDSGLGIVSVPHTNINVEPIQFVIDLTSGSWCVFRSLDMHCMNYNVNGFFFGTEDGRVMQMYGSADNVPFTPASRQSETIVFSMLTHYQDLGTPANWKRVQFIRPIFISDGQPIYGIEARYDFDLKERLNTPPFVDFEVAIWDDAIWGVNFWSATAQRYSETIGARGYGRHIALAMRGETLLPTTYVGSDVILDMGGLL